MLLVVVFWVVFSEALFENVTVSLFLVKKREKDTSVPKNGEKGHFSFFANSQGHFCPPTQKTLMFLKGHFCPTFCESLKILFTVKVKGHFCFSP